MGTVECGKAMRHTSESQQFIRGGVKMEFTIKEVRIIIDALDGHSASSECDELIARFTDYIAEHVEEEVE